MKMVKSIQAAKSGAAEALRSTLRQVSQIKVKQIDFETARPDLCLDILALIEVHGKSHTLACKVEASGRPDHVRTALAALCSDSAVLEGNADTGADCALRFRRGDGDVLEEQGRIPGSGRECAAARGRAIYWKALDAVET